MPLYDFECEECDYIEEILTSSKIKYNIFEVENGEILK